MEKPITTWKQLASAQSPDVKALFGLRPEDKLPRLGAEAIYVDGWRLWINAIPENHTGRKLHRVRGECPHCGKVISVGRVAQHMKIHKED